MCCASRLSLLWPRPKLEAPSELEGGWGGGDGEVRGRGGRMETWPHRERPICLGNYHQAPSFPPSSHGSWPRMRVLFLSRFFRVSTTLEPPTKPTLNRHRQVMNDGQEVSVEWDAARGDEPKSIPTGLNGSFMLVKHCHQCSYAASICRCHIPLIDVFVHCCCLLVRWHSRCRCWCCCCC